MVEITKSELARRLKVSRARVTVYVRRGLPVLQNGKLDEQAAFSWVRSSVAPRGNSNSTAGARLVAIRCRRETAAAEREELELKLRRGQLLERAGVERAWSRLILEARTRLLAIPDRVAPKIPALSGDVAAVRQFVRCEIHEALAELAQYDGTGKRCN